MRTSVLETPVAIHQWELEIDALIALYQRKRPENVLEIGTYDGGTFYHWLRGARRGATVVSVDLYDGPRNRDYDDCPYDPEHDNRELYPAWTPEGVECKVIVGDSTKQSTKTKIRRAAPFYDFCFIDGDHSYEAARSDYNLCLDLCPKGGVIALHDIVPPRDPVPWMEVDRLWREIKASGLRTRELVQRSYQTWGGIGVVYL